MRSLGSTKPMLALPDPWHDVPHAASQKNIAVGCQPVTLILHQEYQNHPKTLRKLCTKPAFLPRDIQYSLSPACTSRVEYATVGVMLLKVNHAPNPYLTDYHVKLHKMCSGYVRICMLTGMSPTSVVFESTPTRKASPS